MNAGIINIPVINAIIQVLFASLVMIIVNPTIKNKLKTIFIIAVITEIVMDGADFINKSFTHNFFFAVYLPMSLFFVGYVYRIKKLQIYSMLMMISFLTYFFVMDGAVEGDHLMIWYPLSTQYYVWNAHTEFLFFSGPTLGVFILGVLAVLFNAIEKRISGVKGIIRLPIPLPSHTGTSISKKSYHSPFLSPRL